MHKMMKWKPKGASTILISKMTDDHIRRAYYMMKRRRKVADAWCKRFEDELARRGVLGIENATILPEMDNNSETIEQ